ncbi:dTMP kinase [Planctomicrobium sp. SH668]|uniref:dTMP kinase n=1 Tax=Planctomicrobium sp. SH668 TaxID=3448126 RepID=UPI003F5AF997
MSESAFAPLIVFEGIDGSGKGTQAKKLHQRFQYEGIRSRLLSFPRYEETFFGKRIGEFLNGEFGSLSELDPFLVSLLYAGDRLESRSLFEEARRESQVVVLDRYVPSNIAHQAAKRTGEQRTQLQAWIEQVEYGIHAVPRPDLVFLLDLSVETSQMLIRKKEARSYTDQTTDLQESNLEYMASVREAYLDLAAKNSTWQTVSIADGLQPRPIEEIHAEIWSKVQVSLQVN